VTAELAARLGTSVSGLRPGMLVTEALDLVFAEQEVYLPIGLASVRVGREAAGLTRVAGSGCKPAQEHLSVAPPVLAPSMQPATVAVTAWTKPLDEAEARELTDRIKSTTRQVCILLFEAHERRAWRLVGYDTWEQYVHSEFGFSRSRSYELVDQGRVIQAVRAAAGMSGIPDISAYAALQVKAHLSSLTHSVAERTASVPQSGMGRVVSQIVHELRARIARERASAAMHLDSTPDGRARNETGSPQPPPAGVVLIEPPNAQLNCLLTAIDLLAHMPPVVEMIAAVASQGPQRFSQLEGALQWLREFTGMWKTQSLEDCDLTMCLDAGDADVAM
jgi:hypothetical protein